MTSGVRLIQRRLHPMQSRAALPYWQVPLPLLMVIPRDTLDAPSVAVINPTCLPPTGFDVTLNAGLTVCPSGMKTLAGTLAPLILLDRLMVKPPAGAGPVR